MREVVFVDGCRSAFGKQGGALSSMAGTEIAGEVIKGMFAMKQLELTGGKYGLFSSCGGGHGTTTVIENLRR